MVNASYIIRKEKDCFIVFDNNLCTFFSLPIKSINYTAKIGKKKIVTNSNLWAKYQEHRYVEVTELSGPISFGVQITNRCNLNCNYCIAKASNIETPVETLEFDKLIDFLQIINPMSIWLSGGEPTLNPNLTSLILLARKKLRSIGIALDTNGVNIKQDLLDFLIDQGIYIRISLDSHIKEIHDSNRRCFNETMNTIDYLVSKKAKFGIMTVVTEHNLDSLIEFSSFLSKKGVKRQTLLELRVGFAPKSIHIKNKNNANEIINQVFHLNKKFEIFTTYISGKKKYSSLIIDPNGILFTSNPLTGEKLEILDVNNLSVQEDWFHNNKVDQKNHFSKYINILNNYTNESYQFI